MSCSEFSLGNISKEFTKDEITEISLNGTVFDYSVDHGTVRRKYILNIHDYLIKK